MTYLLTRHSSCILKCDIKRTMKYACLGSEVHRIKNIKFTVTTMSVRRYKTGCGNGLLACLDYESDKIACLGLQSYKFGFLNTITLHTGLQSYKFGFLNTISLHTEPRAQQPNASESLKDLAVL